MAEVRAKTGGRGVDVALEVVGAPATICQALQMCGVQGRAVVAGVTRSPVQVDTYRELLGPEAELLGSNDHLLGELSELIGLVQRKALDLSDVVVRSVPLDAGLVNGVLDALEEHRAPLRTVIVP